MTGEAAPSILPSSQEAQLFSLSTLVQLGKRARHADTVQELGFIIANETHALLRYRQAVFWRRKGGGRGVVQTISGATIVERNAPFTLWLKAAMARLDRQNATDGGPRAVGAEEIGGALGAEWAEWFPAQGLWVPLRGRRDRVLGAILLVRDHGWSEGERYLAQELADAYASALGAFERRRSSGWGWVRARRTVLQLAIAAIVVASMFLPVSLSALAPAEIVPFQPLIVRAPLDGVVDRFAVKPNERVVPGQPLLDLDRRTIENKLDVATQAFAVAEAEYRQAAQQAVFDDKSRAQLAILKGRMDERRADVTYAQSLLARIHVTASRAGIVLFSDANDWIGRPVTLGEKLMEIADPDQPEIEIWLPVADAIALSPGTAVDFFLNIAPSSPLPATLRQTSYEATMSPAGVLGYRLKATLGERAHLPRIGLRGTAKVYGDRVTLFYYLFRRPLAAARQFVGW